MCVDDVVAALDCGSNSTRLLVADAKGALRRSMHITRLSEGVDATATLLETAMQRTFDVLGEYRRSMDELHVSRGLLVATSAVRDARNGEEFLDRARQVVGVDAKILDGKEEATLSYQGATIGLAPDPRATLILDIGGGSSELAMMSDGALVSFSMQLGCVRVTERALGSAVVDEAHDQAARTMIDTELDRAFSLVPAFTQVIANVRLVGLAGTVATLAQLDAGMSTYQRELVHHRVLDRACVERWRETLASESPQERLGHPGMVVGREDVLTAGLYVLAAVMDRFGAADLLTSENDILDGIAQSLLA
jgi:exopolyphosphatase/guanosine-5'-triphosphate,3'-diphosphate pyrophosphatase